MADPEDYKSISLTASTSLSTLSTATTAAVNADAFDLARAAEGVRYITINIIQQVRNTESVPTTVPDEYREKIENLRRQIELANVPPSRVELCRSELDRCLVSGGSLFCWFNYSMCLANCFISFHIGGGHG